VDRARTKGLSILKVESHSLALLLSKRFSVVLLSYLAIPTLVIEHCWADLSWVTASGCYMSELTITNQPASLTFTLDWQSLG